MIFDEISKYEIAAELIGYNDSFIPRSSYGNTDLNTLLENGIYKINNGGSTIVTNMPAGAYNFGILLVFKILQDSENRTLQLYVSHNPIIAYIRMNNSMRWTNWVKLSSTILE